MKKQNLQLHRSEIRILSTYSSRFIIALPNLARLWPFDCQNSGFRLNRTMDIFQNFSDPADLEIT